MCVNYAPVQRQVLRDIFGVEPPDSEWKAEAWPDYPTPIIRATEDGTREAVMGSFSMVPKGRMPPSVRYYPTANARVETIGKLSSFAKHWEAGQLCLIPATGFYEPNWETGKAVRWKISLPGGEPFAIAGLWRPWPDGAISFTMPTLNADGNSLMKRFHKPGDEKRGVILLPREDWDDWLHCRDPDVARTMLRLLPADQMVAEPAPVPPRAKAAPPDHSDGKSPLVARNATHPQKGPLRGGPKSFHRGMRWRLVRFQASRSTLSE